MIIKMAFKPGIVVYAYNRSTWEAHEFETSLGCIITSQPGLYKETLS
jgi:hypothetical protein